VQSVSGREDWYALGERKPGHILPFINSGDIHRVLFNPSEVYVDHNLFEVSVEAESELGLLLYLNSSVAALFKELIGRANLGEGGLKVEGVDWNSLTCLKAEYLKELSKLGKGKFDKLLERPVKSIFKEVKTKDRQKLDKLVLEAMGLDPAKYLKPIYDGLTELVHERIELAGMRKKLNKAKPVRDIAKLTEQVMKDLLEEGIKSFPSDFMNRKPKPQDCSDVPVPDVTLRLGNIFFGQQEVAGEGFSYQARSVASAKYIIYAHKPDEYVVNLPNDEIIVTKAVTDYERYLKELFQKLNQELLNRTFDHKQSETLSRRIFQDLGLSSISV
jgi:hypothetical protein